MATEAYLLGAIGQLQAALVDIRMQLQGTQRRVAEQKHRLQHQIDQLESERTLHHIELGETRTAAREKPLNNRISQINHECSLLHAQMLQLDRELDSVVRTKTGLLNSLQGLARQLDLMRASPAVRS